MLLLIKYQKQHLYSKKLDKLKIIAISNIRLKTLQAGKKKLESSRYKYD